MRAPTERSSGPEVGPSKSEARAAAAAAVAVRAALRTQVVAGLHHHRDAGPSRVLVGEEPSHAVADEGEAKLFLAADQVFREVEVPGSLGPPDGRRGDGQRDDGQVSLAAVVAAARVVRDGAER